jgi:predicted N-acetyltransferase YhbS
MLPAEVKVLPDLVLRSVRDEHDASRFSAVLAKHLNIVEGLTADSLLRFHPERKLDEFQIVENTATGEVVSTSCFFPWRLRFAGVELSAVQLEMVFTHPQYRRRGLVHRQMERLHQIIEDRGYDIVILWGLPYYYRQFGYCYCVEGLATQSLPAWRVPEGLPVGSAPLRLRPASLKDIPLLAAMYPRSVAGLDVYLDRSEAHWRYLLESVKFPIFLVDAAGGNESVGYVIRVLNKRTAHIFESSLPDQETALALLQLLKKDHDEILVNWPAGGTLARLALSLGSILTRCTQWEFRIPSLSRFLMKIAPVLEKRLAGSAFRNVTTDFVLNLFTEACRIRIQGGRIAAVKPLGYVDTSMGAEGGTLNIPPDAWTRLLFGDRDLDELHESWPDIVVKPQDKGLVSALFPRMKAYLYTPYHYYGPESYTLEEKYLGYYL